MEGSTPPSHESGSGAAEQERERRQRRNQRSDDQRWARQSDDLHAADSDDLQAANLDVGAEEKYRTLFDATEEGYCIIEVLFDEDGDPSDFRFLEVDATFQELTGLEDPVGCRMRSLRPGLEEYWFELYGEVARTGEPRRFEREAAALDRWYHVHAFRVGNPKKHQVAVVFRDITERRRKVRELREAKIYAESIVETLHEPLLVLTTDLRVKSANPAFYEQFEVDPQETIGNLIYELGDGQWDIPVLRELLEDVLPDDDVFDDFEVEHEFESIGPRVMLLNGRRLDHVQLILLGIQDITDRKREEQELREAKREAEKASEAKGDFMATISHELRTPLNAIIGYTDLLLEGVPEPVSSAAEEQVKSIAHGAHHLRQLIEEVLTFSRLEAGRESADETDVSIPDLLDEIRAVVAPLARNEDLRLSLDVEEGAETVRTDPRKLRQILVNLLGNAVKFTDRGSVSLEIFERENEVLFQVSDTGWGIEPEVQEQLFEPFWQGNETDSPAAGGGTGLGLTICRRYADILGGDLSVESTPGEGSTFTLRLASATA